MRRGAAKSVARRHMSPHSRRGFFVARVVARALSSRATPRAPTDGLFERARARSIARRAPRASRAGLFSTHSRMRATTERASTARRLGSAYVQVLHPGADARDTSTPSVMLHTDDERYVFNVSEGFQRLLVERRLRALKRATRVLLTSADSRAAGGLIGMLLTMSDEAMARQPSARGGEEDAGEMARKNLELHGPDARIRALTRAARTLFGNGRAVTLTTRGIVERTRDVVVDDGKVVITSVVIGGGKRDGRDAEAERAAKRSRASEDEDASDEVASYDVKLAGIPGKFDMQAAVKLGVPNGPQRGRLVRGESITLDDGSVVSPEMCVGPESPGPRVVVFDAPTMAHVREASTRGVELFGDLSDLSVVVHLAGAAIVSTKEYAELVKSVFGGAPKDAAHVFANSRAMDDVPVFASSARIQARLHAVSATVFPETNVPESPPPSPSKEDKRRDKVPADVPNALAGKNMFKFTLIPTKNAGADVSAVPRYVPGFVHRRDIEQRTIDLANEAMKPTPPPSPSAEARPGAELPEPEYLRKLKPGDVELVFLGTGSAMPAKYRNVSGFSMQFGGEGYEGNIMLDTGEGSLAQMIRRFGASAVDEKLREMRMVWISHIHADHHVGLPHILTARAEIFRRDGVEPPIIPVVGPRALRRFLDYYEDLERLHCDFIDLSETTQDKWSSETMSPQVARLRTALMGSDLDEIVAVPVHHCAHAYGAKLVGKRGWTMVYSGDTRPCPSLVAAARDATLLVHEATFENGMEEEAVKKRHSTTKEAVQTGIDAGAYRTILTHFSQRYPKIPIFDGTYTERTTVAFDLMSVDFAGLTSLPKLLPAVRSLFESDDEIAREAQIDGDDE